MIRTAIYSTLTSIFLCQPGQVHAQEVSSGTGQKLNFDLGYGIMTNPGSTLQQNWYTLKDPSLPVFIDPTTFGGLEVLIADRRYAYRTKMSLNVLEPTQAVEVVIIPFDTFNKSGRPLSLTEITDMQPGSVKIDGEWNVFSETAALGTLTSFAYVAKVRLANGTVLAADPGLVLEEARKISAGLVASDIAPVPDKGTE